MEKRREAYRENIREMSQGGKGSIHPDFNPDAEGVKVGGGGVESPRRRCESN